jgi:hypothetical protein
MENGPLQLSLFDDRDMAEISVPDLFTGERLIVCRMVLPACVSVSNRDPTQMRVKPLK